MQCLQIIEGMYEYLLCVILGMNMEDFKQTVHWRIILAAALDFLTAFFVFGFVISMIFGGNTENGFTLSGLPALILLALIFLYFWVARKYFGRTIWKRVFSVPND